MIDRIKSRLLHYTWDLAYGAYHEDILRNGLKDGLKDEKVSIVSNPYRNKWFADPFIYSDDEASLQLFVEEYDVHINKGRIARIKINKSNNTIVDCSIILEKPSHLSFPAIYQVGDMIYVHPENSASGKSIVYRYDKEIDKLVDPVVIIEEPLTDAIIRETDGGYLMYATKMPVPNGNELFVYKSDSFLGPYVYHDKIVHDKAFARMAGAFIQSMDGDIIRPAQDCEGGDYGKAVHLMLGKRIMRSLTPPTKVYSGLHTFNTLGNSFVVDLKRYDLPWLYRLKTFLRK